MAIGSVRFENVEAAEKLPFEDRNILDTITLRRRFHKVVQPVKKMDVFEELQSLCIAQKDIGIHMGVLATLKWSGRLLS